MTKTTQSNQQLFVRWVLIPILATVASLIASWPLVQKEGLWLDETAQMNGLTLGPLEVVGWLTGEGLNRFSGLTDRMPPLSYWIGWSWSQLFGLNEFSLRILGLSMILGATYLISLAGVRLAGPFAGLLAGLIFGLSPNVIAQGLEIRAYSIFIFCSALVFFQFVELMIADRNSWIRSGLLTLTLLAATYTHYYGLVLSGAVFVGWFGYGLLTRRGIRDVLIMALIFGVASLGIIPFVLTSADLSDGGGVDEGGRTSPLQVIRLIAILVSHPVLLQGRWERLVLPAGLSLTGLAGLVGLLLGLRRPDQRNRMIPLFTISLSLVAGLTATTIASQLTSSFQVFKSNYNVWYLPAVGLMVALVIRAVPSGWLRSVGYLGGSLILVAQIGGMTTLVRFEERLDHGPYQVLESAYDRLETDRVAIIFEADNVWPLVAWPATRIIDSPSLLLRPAETDGTLEFFEALAKSPGEPQNINDLETFDAVMVIQVKQRDWESILRGGDRVLEPVDLGPVGQLLNRGHWERGERIVSVDVGDGRAAWFLFTQIDQFRVP